MPERQARHPSSVLGDPLARLAASRDALVKDWLLRLVGRSSLEEIERMPTDRMARELPKLVEDLVRALAPEDQGGRRDPPEVAAEGASRLAGFRAEEGRTAASLARDIASLHSVMLEALGREVADAGPEVMAYAAGRLAELFGAVQAAAIDELVSDRSRELEWLANTDALTGLYNVRFLREHLDHLLGVQKRYGHPFAVLLLDVDGLKRVNDAHGHAAGDDALKAVAAAMRETVRSIDTPVRMGGDEFCVLAPHQTASRARQLGERLGAAVERRPTRAGGPVGVSIGVVSCPQHSVQGERLLELADMAMYRAKSAGELVAVGSPEGGAAEEGMADHNGR